jgi:catechol 2,3-dioxygenase-like lactoylglutathione lyase family enzyme
MNSPTGTGQSRHIPTARCIDHIGLTVPSLAQAKAFFVDFLGAHVTWEAGPFADDGEWMTENLNVHPRASCCVSMLRVGPTMNIELFEYHSPDHRNHMPRNSDVGASHVAFYVDDIEAAVAYLREIPGVVIQHGPNLIDDGSATAGIRFCYFLTPWGQQMELVSAPAGMAYETTAAHRMAPPSVDWTDNGNI